MPTTPDKLPPGAARLMIAMLALFALVAIYANVQRARRDKIDIVTITSPSQTPSPSPQRR